MIFVFWIIGWFHSNSQADALFTVACQSSQTNIRTVGRGVTIAADDEGADANYLKYFAGCHREADDQPPYADPVICNAPPRHCVQGLKSFDVERLCWAPAQYGLARAGAGGDKRGLAAGVRMPSENQTTYNANHNMIGWKSEGWLRKTGAISVQCFVINTPPCQTGILIGINLGFMKCRALARTNP